MRLHPRPSRILFPAPCTKNGASLCWKPLRADLIGTLLMRTSFGPFFIEPVIAGLPPKTELEPNPKPFISCMDT